MFLIDFWLDRHGGGGGGDGGGSISMKGMNLWEEASKGGCYSEAEKLRERTGEAIVKETASKQMHMHISYALTGREILF